MAIVSPAFRAAGMTKRCWASALSATTASNHNSHLSLLPIFFYHWGSTMFTMLTASVMVMLPLPSTSAFDALKFSEGLPRM